MTASSAYLKVHPDGQTGVSASLRLTGDSHIMCCTYTDIPPILSVDDRCVSVSVTVPDQKQVTADDLATARRLADAVAEYITGLERHIAAQEHEGAAGRAA